MYFYAKYNDKESQARACFYDIKEERKLEVESGEALDINGSTINVAADGQTVCLSAKKMLNNMSFSRWSVTSSASVELKDASETETTFTMPDSDVSIKANYVEVAASASVVLPTLAVGDILPSTSKVTFKNSSGEVLDTLDDVALKWVKADGSILEAGAVAEANTSYIVSIEISLDKGAEFILGEDIAVDFAGKAATSKTGPNNAGLVNATYKVELTNNSTPTPKAKTVKYKSCTYTLYGNTLRLTKVPKAKKKVVIPAKIKINGKKVKVKSIKKKVFKKTKVKKIVIKSPYLKKKGVKKSLKSSKVKIVKIKVYSKAKANKKQIKKYKRYFSKVNCGKKVKVK